MDATWQGVFLLIIMVVIAALGAPVTQFVKVKLKIEDRWALLLTLLVSAGFAVGEMFLSGAVNFAEVSVENFPQYFFGVFSVMQVYYQALKNSPSIFGLGGLLKDSDGQG